MTEDNQQPVETTTEEQTQQPVNPADAGINIAAQHYDMYLPLFKGKIRNLSKKQAIRLLSALVEYPLQKAPYHHNQQSEKDAFLIGDKLLQSKYMMILFSLAASQEMNQAANDVLDQATSASEGEQANG